MLTATFFDVGQGSMVLLRLDDDTTLLYDCNVTDENAGRVLGDLGVALFPRQGIDLFVNSHREADHMRGVRQVHQAFPISAIWDSGVTGVTTDSSEYREYMALRPTCGRWAVARHMYRDFGATRVWVLNSRNDQLPDDPNAQSIVLKVENWRGGVLGNSLMLTGDSDTRAWKDSIIPTYGSGVASTILMASHHGADSFVCHPDGDLYLDHLQVIRPRMTVVSVGDNGYGHPDPVALVAYGLYSTGADLVIGGPPSLRVLRTDRHGTMRLELRNDGSWAINWRGPSPRPAHGGLAALARLALPDIAPNLWGILGPYPPSTPAASLFPPLAGLADISRLALDQIAAAPLFPIVPAGPLDVSRGLAALDAIAGGMRAAPLLSLGPRS